MESRHPAITVPPDLVPYIFPGERIINLEHITTPPQARAPSGLRELYRLAQAKVKNNLYELSAPLASLAFASATSPELHRYETLFARDALRVAMDLIGIFPQIARTTLLTLASVQGTVTHAGREEEPGRIPHEIRDPQDQVAKKLSSGRGWEWPYYGSVDATPEFIRLLITYHHRTSKTENFLQQTYTDKDGQPCTMQTALVRAVDWVLYRTGSNIDGLLESKTALPHGIENQVWKDSWDAYFHKDGRIANHQQGVASVEVQRLAYEALLDAAYLYDAELGVADKAEELRQRAALIRQTLFDHFWTSANGGYFVLGTDRDDQGHLRQLEVRTSNMGHLLHSRLLVGDNPQLTTYRQAIIRHLFSPAMLAAGGIRTLAADEMRFRPGAYHNGSVWLWDTYLIIKGLRRHGYHHLATTLTEKLLHVVDITRAFPEFVRGDTGPTPTINTRIVDVWDDTYARVNRIEQPPQQVQAWSVGAIVAIRHYARTFTAPPPPDAFEQSILAQLG